MGNLICEIFISGVLDLRKIKRRLILCGNKKHVLGFFLMGTTNFLNCINNAICADKNIYYIPIMWN